MPRKDLDARREYQRAYQQRNRERLTERKRQWFKEHWDASEEFRSAHRTTISKEAHAAHQRVRKAILRGEIQRPTHCPECGRETFVEAAHENYSDRLAIRWLCRPCHRKWDAEQSKGAAQESEQRVYHTPKRDLRQLVCAGCGTPFQVSWRQRYEGRALCCSKSCGVRLAKQRSREARIAQGIGVYSCNYCGTRIERAPGMVHADTVFCNRKCSARFRWQNR